MKTFKSYALSSMLFFALPGIGEASCLSRTISSVFTPNKMFLDDMAEGLKSTGLTRDEIASAFDKMKLYDVPAKAWLRLFVEHKAMLSPRDIEKIGRGSFYDIEAVANSIQNRLKVDAGNFDRAHVVATDGKDVFILKLDKGKWRDLGEGYPTSVNDIFVPPQMLEDSLGQRISLILGLKGEGNSFKLPTPEAYNAAIAKHNAKFKGSPNEVVISFRITENEVSDGRSYLNMLIYDNQLPMGKNGRILAHDVLAHGDNFLIPKEFVELAKARIRAVVEFLDELKIRNPKLYEMLNDARLSKHTIDEVIATLVYNLDTSTGNFRSLSAAAHSKLTPQQALDSINRYFSYDNILFKGAKPSSYASYILDELVKGAPASVREELKAMRGDFFKANAPKYDAGLADPQTMTWEATAQRIREMNQAFGSQ